MSKLRLILLPVALVSVMALSQPQAQAGGEQAAAEACDARTTWFDIGGAFCLAGCEWQAGCSCNVGGFWSTCCCNASAE